MEALSSRRAFLLMPNTLDIPGLALCWTFPGAWRGEQGEVSNLSGRTCQDAPLSCCQWGGAPPADPACLCSSLRSSASSVSLDQVKLRKASAALPVHTVFHTWCKQGCIFWSARWDPHFHNWIFTDTFWDLPSMGPLIILCTSLYFFPCCLCNLSFFG